MFGVFKVRACKEANGEENGGDDSGPGCEDKEKVAPVAFVEELGADGKEADPKGDNQGVVY